MTLILSIFCASILAELPAVSVPDFTVTSSGVAGITSETTHEDLTDIFGTANIEDTREHMGEGYYSEGTEINSGSPFELAVIWAQENTPFTAASIMIRGYKVRTAEDIGIGSTLTELEEIIGEFEMSGFAWDYEGYVYLTGTIYENLYIRLTPTETSREEQPELWRSLMGDDIFTSASMREINPVVTDFRILF
ncbi:MAG: hypothetical protein K8S62_14700 [Candidatus Sabulitectum sp.]|nr:hypothetical protein [Candidatus Sabulitectum sp.]